MTAAPQSASSANAGPPPLPRPRGRRGFLFWGAIVVAALAVAVLVSGLVLGRKVKRLVLRHTDSTPLEISAVELGQDAQTRAREKQELLERAIGTGSRVTLELSPADLNAMIAMGSQEGLPELQKHLALDIRGDILVARMSLPMELIFAGMAGRYLNGEMHLKLNYENGRLTANPRKITVRGVDLPETMMEQLRALDFAEEALRRNPELRTALEPIEMLRVQDGLMTIRTRSRNPLTEADKPR